VNFPVEKIQTEMPLVQLHFHINIVTAIVSPTALPNPKIDAPIKPDFAYGKTDILNTSPFCGT
jgi:hypothetical protein